MSQELREVKYRCTHPECRHEQVISYFVDDKILPVTCCVKCRAGFGRELSEQMMHKIGMFPVSEAA